MNRWYAESFFVLVVTRDGSLELMIRLRPLSSVLTRLRGIYFLRSLSMVLSEGVTQLATTSQISA